MAKSSVLERVKSSPVLWSLAALVVLLLANLVKTPSFFAIRLQDGHLYGSLVDILRNGAPTMLVAIGMTLVIATRGIDLSVGALAAIAGAVACTHIVGAGDPTGATAAFVGMVLALVLCLVLGLWNGFLVSVVGIQPIIATLVLMTAGRGIAMLITDGRSSQCAIPPIARSGRGTCSSRWPSSSPSPSSPSWRSSPPHRAWDAHRVGGHRPRGQPSRGCARARSP